MKNIIILTIISTTCLACTNYQGTKEWGVFARTTPHGYHEALGRDEMNIEIIKNTIVQNNRTVWDLFKSPEPTLNFKGLK